MDNGFPKSVNEFFKEIEKEQKDTLEDNCIFSLSFINPKKDLDITITLAGKELLGYCTMVLKSISKLIDKDVVNVTLRVISTGNKISYSKLCNLFEEGIRIVSDPEALFNDEEFEKFKLIL